MLGLCMVFRVHIAGWVGKVRETKEPVILLISLVIGLVELAITDRRRRLEMTIGDDIEEDYQADEQYDRVLGVYFRLFHCDVWVQVA